MNKHELNKLSNDFFKNEFINIRNVAIDLECLQDIKLGALLSLISTETEYKYILSKLEQYNTSTYRTITDMFPVLDITEDMIDAYIKDKANHRKLSIISPYTNLHDSLKVLVELIEDINTKSVETVEIWNLYICCGKLSIRFMSQKHLFNLLKSFSSKVHIHFVDEYTQDMDIKLLKSMDHIVVYDIISFIDIKKPSGDTFFNKNLFFKTSIVGVEQTDPTIELDSTETLKQILDRTATYLNIFCNFQFVERQIPIRS